MNERNINCNCPGLALKKLMDEKLRALWKERKLKQFLKLFARCLTIPYHEEDCPVFSSINDSEVVTLKIVFKKKWFSNKKEQDFAN